MRTPTKFKWVDVTGLWSKLMQPEEVADHLFSAEEIWGEESKVVQGRRQVKGHADAAGVRPLSLTGLCLSGGGIRSATFSLGVLQGLEQAGALRIFDYLSTVSGGGFVGAWWTAWLFRNPTGTFPAPEQITLNRPQARNAQEAEWYADVASAGIDPVHHLRLYSNYLTPRKGLLSEDTWRAGTIIVRNLLLTWLILLPFLFAAILVADTYYVLVDPSWIEADARVLPVSWRLVVWLTPVAALLGWLAVSIVVWMEYARVGRLRRATPLLSLSVAVILAVSLISRSASVAGISAVRAAGPLALAGQWAAFFLQRPLGRSVFLWTMAAVALVAQLRSNPNGVNATVMRARILWWQIRLAVVTCAAVVILGVAGLGHELIQYLIFGPRAARGCRNVLCVDCGADAKPCFEDLGTAIRRCRIDFGTNIDIDLDAGLTSTPAGRHYLAGKIMYGAAHAATLGMDDKSRQGVIVILKPRVLHTDESADVRQYKYQNDQFPQQGTADQWFDEAQFESYRKLGEISAKSLLKDLTPSLANLQAVSFNSTHVQRFFDDMYQHCSRPPEISERSPDCPA